MLINTREFSNSFMVFITGEGAVKRVRAEKFARPRSNGVNAIPLKANDELADVRISNGSSELFVSTILGKSIRFDEKDIRPMSRMAHGIRGIRLKGEDKVVNIMPVSSSDFVMSVTEKGYGKVTELAATGCSTGAAAAYST